MSQRLKIESGDSDDRRPERLAVWHPASPCFGGGCGGTCGPPGGRTAIAESPRPSPVRNPTKAQLWEEWVVRVLDASQPPNHCGDHNLKTLMKSLDKA
jgi:hypothetical protein